MLFVELLQIAIGNRKSLSYTPTKEQWTALFALSKKHALLAFVFAGVSKLNPSSDFGASLGMDEMTYLKWLGFTAKVEQRNKKQNEACVSLCKELAHDGLACCIRYMMQ